jgi:hypothetical protein
VTRLVAASLALVLALLIGLSRATPTTNPDQITVFFPAFDGPGSLGQNASIVLSLQLAQTSRRIPWPENPDDHDFGPSEINWSVDPLSAASHEAADAAAKRRERLAQIVVWGRAFSYGDDVVVEPSVTLPQYRRAPSFGCEPHALLPCDFRQVNFEHWSLQLDGEELVVDVPRRRFRTSAIVLRPEVVERFRNAAGLPIRESVHGGRILGRTGSKLQFIEFNRRLPGAPTKLRSGGVEGYVSLPELSERTSEFADMVGGILQIFRGDWDEAVRSFTRVINNPKTRTPLRVDALLFLGMAATRGGNDGRASFRVAAELAPFDHMVVRYLVMGEIAAGGSPQTVRRIVDDRAFLFPKDDPWLRRVRGWLARN